MTPISNVTTPPMTIPLSRPDITDADRQRVMDVLETPILSIGPHVKAFEEELAAVAGVRHAVAVNSGTSARHLAMVALGIGPGDEVITTPFSFIASSNCILYAGATPVFVDIEPRALCIDPAKIEAAITPRTKAILAVDVFGHPFDWARVEAIAKKHNLKLIEDSAEAIGSRYHERRAGSVGDVGIFAFYPNKQITTGEGGALVTDDPEIARLTKSLRNQGRGDGNSWLSHERLGYNFRISEINSALGRAQLSRLPEIVKARSDVAMRYHRALARVRGVEVQPILPGVDMSWFVYVVRLDRRYAGEKRDRAIGLLREQGVSCSNYFPCIHLESFYRESLGCREGMFPVAEDVSMRTIALPFHNRLTDAEIEYVADRLERTLKQVG